MKLAPRLLAILLTLAATPSSSLANAVFPAFGIVAGTALHRDDPITRSVVGILIDVADSYGNDSRLCTGVIVADDLILTAAHCLAGAEPGDLKIVFGPNVDSDFARTGRAKSFLTHPGYSKGTNDIALVKLASAVPPRYLPVSQVDLLADELRSGEDVVIAGYGDTRDHSTTNAHREGDSGILHTKVVRLHDAAIRKGEILLDQPDGGTCVGDSGGPAFVTRDRQLVLFGIAKSVRGRRDALCSKTAIYTPIAVHVEFLERAMKALRR
jgi:secreted trypsin-like serine protease